MMMMMMMNKTKIIESSASKQEFSLNKMKKKKKTWLSVSILFACISGLKFGSNPTTSVPSVRCSRFLPPFIILFNDKKKGGDNT